MTYVDTLKACISCVAIGLGTLLWVFFSGQSLVARKLSVAVGIVIRIAIVHAIVVPVLCIGGGIPIDYLAIPLAITLVVASLVTLKGAGEVLGDDPLGAAIAAVIVLPPYVIKQFVLGFPDHGEFVLEPPDGKSRETSQNTLATQDAAERIAVVVTPLKPFGYIDVDGQRLAASSSTGMLIDVGQRVRICSRNNNAVVVEPVVEPSATP